MSNPPLNVEYWSSLYRVYTDYAEQYSVGIASPRVVDRAEKLWEWKGLNRSIPFEEIAPTIEGVDWDDYLEERPQDAIESLSDHLVEEDVIGPNGLVTPAFLLHLAASDPDRYSATFPIYDRRVWNAYVYLWRLRDEDGQLYAAASHSTDQYAAFCRAFRRTCPDGDAREYERALFMFGGFIMDLPPNDSPTPIATIDDHLERQERAIARREETAGYALVDIDGVRA
ncbi:hypothetical protein AB7C87_13080 [Natrarchaeobius sp. A-rgal3]|uniref:hypothetical protein n=1 Tax=Natrarchaeobius versutus TaxID=1679078 RepID=UPI00350F85BC